MMRQITLTLLIAGFYGLLLPAQSDIVPVVYSISGKVTYAASPDGKYKKLKNGTELTTAGNLKLKSGAAVGIYYDGEFAVVNTAGEQSVETITSDLSLFRESEVADMFGEVLEKALHPYFQLQAAGRSGFASLSDPPPPPPPKPVRDGHGNKEYKVVRQQPTGGKVAGNRISFKWSLQAPDKRIKKFRFILQSASDEVLLEKEVKGYAYQLMPSDYQLEPGQFYKWQVISSDDEGMKSPPVLFEAVPASEREALLNKLGQAEMYQTAEPTAQLLLRASLLEKEDFFSEANELYEMARKTYKKDPLVQMMQQSFQWRQDMIE